jgi:hypothetical protein
MMKATGSPKNNYFFPGITDEVRRVKVFPRPFRRQIREYFPDFFGRGDEVCTPVAEEHAARGLILSG